MFPLRPPNPGRVPQARVESPRPGWRATGPRGVHRPQWSPPVPVGGPQARVGSLRPRWMSTGPNGVPPAGVESPGPAEWAKSGEPSPERPAATTGEPALTTSDSVRPRGRRPLAVPGQRTAMPRAALRATTGGGRGQGWKGGGGGSGRRAGTEGKGRKEGSATGYGHHRWWYGLESGDYQAEGQWWRKPM